MNDYMDSYPYLDFFFMKGDRPTKWRRLHADRLPEAINEASAFNCYTSVQRFSSPEPATADQAEMHYCPPYLDFDSANLATAQSDMRRVVDFCRDLFDLEDEAIRVWFSGSKGFHVTLSPLAFGIVPMLDLSYVYKRMFSHLAEYLSLTTLDLSVYSKRRMWRVPNTIHAATNLYKRELDHDEITLEIPDILALARTPRRDPIYRGDPDLQHPVSLPAQDFFLRFREEYNAEKEATSASAARVTLHPEAAPGDPVCVQDIMSNGLKKPGDRNKATMALGGYYKDTKVDIDTATETLTSWALALPTEHRHGDDRHVIANTRSVLRTVYESPAYGFSCKFIRSLHGPKTSLDYERVACQGDACPFIRGLLPEEEVIDVHLSRIGDPALLGRQIRTRLRVAGRQESAYLVPSQVRYRAINDSCDRPHCALHEAGGVLEKDFATDTRTLLTLCGVPDQQVQQNLRRVVERRSCKMFTYDVLSYVRVIEMTCVPKAESAVYNAEEGRQTDEFGGDFSYQRVYAIALDFRVNAYYEVEGRVYPHPRHQEATLVVTAATPTQDAIETFDLDAARPLFAAYQGDPAETLGHLLADVGVNVCRVGGREHALLALLMSMHAPLHLRLFGDSYGGWLNTLMIGDTGEAKSQLVERLVRHVGLGELCSAQSSGRTGLLYTIITKDTSHNFIQWGSFVLNDRRLLVIDEASGIDRAGYAELRNARRDGIFTVNRSVTGEAQTRTRLVVLSNPRYGKNMSEFHTGIEAVEPLFENADIRRFDLVVGFRAGTVSRERIEQALSETVEHLFTSAVLRANVLWAWSREADDIVWTPGSQEHVRSVARTLNRKYGGSDLHLLSQDANEKIARLSQALAATLHSTDETHRQVIVTTEHVDYVSHLIDSLYGGKDLDFSIYVQQNQTGAGEIDYDEIMRKIHLAISLPLGIDKDDLMRYFSRNKVIAGFALEALAGDHRDAKVMLRVLFRLDLLKATQRNAFEPTRKLIELCRQWQYRQEAVAQ